jgi:hypothetical protein
VSGLKLRAGLLGLLALLLLGSYAATPAFAEGGPYCHHREVGTKTEGEKIEEKSPEQFKTEGAEQKFEGEVGGAKIEVVAKHTQAKGIIYNNPDQCQSKVELQFKELSVTGVSGCSVVVNGNNIIKLYGHRAWSYNGETKQLEEKPQLNQKLVWIFTPVELLQEKEELPNATFATLKFSGVECVLAGVTVEAKGTAGAESKPEAVEVWGTKEEQIYTKGEVWLHFWNGKKFVPAKTGITLAGKAAAYVGVLKLETTGHQQKPAQEVADYEK